MFMEVLLTKVSNNGKDHRVSYCSLGLLVIELGMLVFNRIEEGGCGNKDTIE